MKVVSFGFENSENPAGSFEGIGKGDGAKGAVTAAYLDVFSYEGRNFLVTRTTEAFKGSETEIGKIDVRDTLVDLFQDGSAILYIDQTQSKDALDFQTLLNTPKAAQLVGRGISIKDICNGYNAPISFMCATYNDRVLATAIKHDVFAAKFSALKQSNKSFSNMKRELDSVSEELYKLKGSTSATYGR